MNKTRRLLRKSRKNEQSNKQLAVKVTPIVLLLVSIIFLLINHINSGQSVWFFIVGLITFSFTTAYYLITALEHYLPSALVKHQLWTGDGIGGKGLAGLLCGILAIAIMLGFTYLLKILNVDYIR